MGIIKQAPDIAIKGTLKSFDLFFLIGLIFVAASVSGGILTELFEDPRPRSAQKDLEKYAKAMLHMSGEFHVEGLQMRQPASVEGAGDSTAIQLQKIGSIGKDPWGEPYHYMILPPKGENPAGILIWSAGSDHKFQSELNMDRLRSGQFSGDDIGYRYTAR